MSAKKTGYQHHKQNDETEQRKKECIRLHVEMNLGVTAISNRLHMNKALVKKWLVKASVYKTGGRSSARINKPIRRSIPTGWRRAELQSEIVGWNDYDRAMWRCFRNEIVKPAYTPEKWQRLMSNPVQRIKFYARKRVRKAFKEAMIRKSFSISKLIGCTGAQLVEHIKKQFKPGMTLENHGVWHIDHIRPLASFNLLNDEDVRAACHYTNLQPLWAAENISKSNKIIGSSLSC